jgi:hypothetical protein
MANHTHPEILAAAANDAAYDPDRLFTISESDAPSQKSTVVAPLEHVPEHAKDHVPSDLPDGLPQAALDHMSDTANAQLTDHVEWLNLNPVDRFAFSTADVPSQSSTPPLEHVAEEAVQVVPADQTGKLRRWSTTTCPTRPWHTLRTSIGSFRNRRLAGLNEASTYFEDEPRA